MHKQNNKLPADFNWKTYLELNTDLTANNIHNVSGAIKHYLQYGIKENRIYHKNDLPDDFDWNTYLKLNVDVEKNVKTKNDAINHYLKYGIKENRIYNITHEIVINNKGIKVRNKSSTDDDTNDDWNEDNKDNKDNNENIELNLSEENVEEKKKQNTRF